MHHAAGAESARKGTLGRAGALWAYQTHGGGIVYLKTLVVAASLVFAASAIAQQRTQSQTPPGNTPGHRMQNDRHSTAPGASEFAPGHQKNTNAGPGHSESETGQMRHRNTGMKDGRR